MANKRQRKKRMRKLEQIEQLELVMVVELTPPVIQMTVTAKELFETKLNEVYNGTVTPVTAYVNNRAVMVFNCSQCGYTFFGKAGRIVGKEHQQHLCNMPYANSSGERMEHVGSRHKARKKSEKQQQAVIDKVNTMIWNDCTYKEIASELKVNPKILKDYFISEGLL